MKVPTPIFNSDARDDFLAMKDAVRKRHVMDAVDMFLNSVDMSPFCPEPSEPVDAEQQGQGAASASTEVKVEAREAAPANEADGVDADAAEAAAVEVTAAGANALEDNGDGVDADAWGHLHLWNSSQRLQWRTLQSEDHLTDDWNNIKQHHVSQMSVIVYWLV